MILVCDCTSTALHTGNGYDGTASTAIGNTCGCCDSGYGHARLTAIDDSCREEAEEVENEMWEALRISEYILPPLMAYIESRARAPPAKPKNKTKKFYRKALEKLRAFFNGGGWSNRNPAFHRTTEFNTALPP